MPPDIRKEIGRLRAAIADIVPSLMVKGRPELSYADICRKQSLRARLAACEAAERNQAREGR